MEEKIDFSACDPWYNYRGFLFLSVFLNFTY